MQSVVLTLKPRRAERYEQRGGRMAADKPAYPDKRSRRADLFSRILEAAATVTQLVIILAVVGLLGGLELIGLPECLMAMAGAGMGIGAAGWLKYIARGLRDAA